MTCIAQPVNPPGSQEGILRFITHTQIEIYMLLEELLTPQRCFARMDWPSKKRILASLSDCLAGTSRLLDSDEVYTGLITREQLGSTGLGNGIAIPHCRVAKCTQITGALVTLEEPVDYDAIDNNPVDLFFVLIVPEEKSDEHIKILAVIAELLDDKDFCLTLRTANDNEDLYSIAITHQV